jgi:hypothetical protein
MNWQAGQRVRRRRLAVPTNCEFPHFRVAKNSGSIFGVDDVINKIKIASE